MRQIGYQIIAISADRPSKLQESLDEHDLEVQVLSDSSMAAATRFGLAWQMPADMVKKYVEYDIDLGDAAGLDHHVLPVPAVFVVDTAAVVRFQYVNPSHRVRLNVDVLLAVARSEMASMLESESTE